jgi:hypothetical protein
MEGEHFAEFQVFYRIVHRSRWPKDIETAPECLLEQYYQQGIETGGRVREHLRDGVEQALKIFGNGFLSYPENHELRQNVKGGKLDASDYYRQLLRLIYRFLFLMVSEERNLVGPDPENDHLRKVYDQHYSISRLREKVERPANMDEKFWDLWEGVKQAFRFYSYESFGGKLGIAPLNGDLFGPHAMPNLENAFLYNRDFLRGFAHLSIFIDNKSFRRINYAHLDVEELGSVYESLLDYHPIIQESEGSFKFELVFGTERKSTGSYYTRSELVQELIKSALVPVIEERLKNAKTPQEKEQALLSLKVCDTSTGSGHFLLAAARRIGRELAKVRSGEDEPTPSEFRLAVRDVIQHCIYGVDLNPLAVDLCKVSLWLEGHNRGYPLTFLDHRIKCGNSLIGLDKLERLKDGIPDDAFKPVTGDNKEVAKKIKARNRQERKDWETGIMKLPFDMEDKLVSDLRSFAERAQSIDAISEKLPEDVARKQEQYQKIRADESWWKDWTAANIWTAAFFYPLTKIDDPAIPTHDRLMRYIENPKAAHGQLVGKANALAAKQRFFHWPLEFPEIAKAGGFDVVLGNPPWERIKLQEQEFFATRDTEIANAPNKAVRTKLINQLVEKNPVLLKEFIEAKHDAESDSRFVREACRFPLTAVGDVNTYPLFAELSKNIISKSGRSGIITPTGIATDDSTKYFFQELIKNRRLASLYDFDNRNGIFPAVEKNIRFCLLTISNKPVNKVSLSSQLYSVELINNQFKKYSLSVEEIVSLNPNTMNCPTFSTAVDAKIISSIHQRIPILINESSNSNLWKIDFLRMFDMSNDSHLFKTREQLERAGLQLASNIFKNGEAWLPLYEAKLVYQYNHRVATFDRIPEKERFKIHAGTNKSSPEDLINHDYIAIPRYWVLESEVVSLCGYEQKWFIGFRNAISSVADSRSLVASIVPFSGIGNSLPLLILKGDKKGIDACLLLSMINSIVIDYILKQKAVGGNLNFYIFKQLPILPSNAFSENDISFLIPRTLELVYTSWDLKPFAEDMGYDGPPFKWDEERRVLLRAELDAYYAKLYGLTRDELRYILDPQDIYGPNFPGETFRVLKAKEIKQYGEYRTRRLVLEAWDRLFGEK